MRNKLIEEVKIAVADYQKPEGEESAADAKVRLRAAVSIGADCATEKWFESLSEGHVYDPVKDTVTNIETMIEIDSGWLRDEYSTLVKTGLAVGYAEAKGLRLPIKQIQRSNAFLNSTANDRRNLPDNIQDLKSQLPKVKGYFFDTARGKVELVDENEELIKLNRTWRVTEPLGQPVAVNHLPIFTKFIERMSPDEESRGALLWWLRRRCVDRKKVGWALMLRAHKKNGNGKSALMTLVGYLLDGVTMTDGRHDSSVVIPTSAELASKDASYLEGRAFVGIDECFNTKVSGNAQTQEMVKSLIKANGTINANVHFKGVTKMDFRGDFIFASNDKQPWFIDRADLRRWCCIETGNPPREGEEDLALKLLDWVEGIGDNAIQQILGWLRDNVPADQYVNKKPPMTALFRELSCAGDIDLKEMRILQAAYQLAADGRRVTFDGVTQLLSIKAKEIGQRIEVSGGKFNSTMTGIGFKSKRPVIDGVKITHWASVEKTKASTSSLIEDALDAGGFDVPAIGNCDFESIAIINE